MINSESSVTSLRYGKQDCCNSIDLSGGLGAIGALAGLPLTRLNSSVPASITNLSILER